jgi:hypothetical protein
MLGVGCTVDMTIGNASVKTLVLETMARNIVLTLVKLLLFQQLNNKALEIPKLCKIASWRERPYIVANKNVLKMG